ncbi:16S rRNA (guanine(966)-N(2))-methyltransferase RsmD [Paradesulfitobacterium ferrireducens]|uniref:16S rRNA (guanine(966)-N(2))-methyltransferase RsmD n=1 Tax=Paradesulfitobacterium ferrireducens TaxID=2816476 RepID=UPI001A8C75A9|nr:16S rRNA (guanine(966)-N(2))-methyltransferase RsmD [Paradesulfitobacterium ferrireducens]
MRIIAGEMRGRRLKSPEGDLTRPTADKVKGAIFNVLRDKVAGARVLDLFAGTGSLALEALSRHAASAVLVEQNEKALRVLKENLKIAGAEEKVELIALDAFRFLNTRRDQVFDLIFLDPPYHRGLMERALQELAEPCRLSADGVIVAETAKDEELNTIPPEFELRQTGEYGDTKVWYLQRIPSDSGLE